MGLHIWGEVRDWLAIVTWVRERTEQDLPCINHNLLLSIFASIWVGAHTTSVSREVETARVLVRS
jgi:hypothetical protein